MRTTKLIIVGGFWGAGKTTWLWKAAQKLTIEELAWRTCNQDALNPPTGLRKL